MNVFEKIFKQKSETLSVEVVEPIDERRQELATVQVKDIKEYLLEEYERSKGLVDQVEMLKRQLFESKETKIKYDATLVTLDEYKERLNSYEKKFSEYEMLLSEARDETDSVRYELNDYKIRFQRASITKDEIKMEVIEEIKGKIIKAIMEHKGNLSKTKAVEIVRGVQ